jgi:predicted ferric reductase
MMRNSFIWFCVVAIIVIPLSFAANSSLLQWREPPYIIAGFAGVLGLAVLFCQPLLAQGALPGINLLQSRRLHRLLGFTLLVSVVIHVAGLWVSSPPDVIDALLFQSPTAFSLWGVIAMWLVIATSIFATMRSKLRLSQKLWRRLHTVIGLVIVVCSVIHALLIDGTMEFVSKLLLCGFTVLATAIVVFKQY